MYEKIWGSTFSSTFPSQKPFLETFSRETNIAQRFSVVSNENQIPNQPQSYNISSNMNYIQIEISETFSAKYNQYPPHRVADDIHIKPMSLIKYVSLEVTESK
jgi:hypothetical protein